MNLKDVVTFIITDASVGNRDGVNAVITAIRERQKLNNANQTALAKATLRIGDTISVSGISPKYLNGMQGKIKSFNQTRSRADIEITDNRGDRRVAVGAIKHGYPIQCLTVINAMAGIHEIDHDSSVLDFLDA